MSTFHASHFGADRPLSALISRSHGKESFFASGSKETVTLREGWRVSVLRLLVQGVLSYLRQNERLFGGWLGSTLMAEAATTPSSEVSSNSNSLVTSSWPVRAWASS